MVCTLYKAKPRKAVSYARGVRKIVKFGATPVKADIVMIHAKSGPFVGLEAVFMRETSGHQWTMVFLRALAL